MVVAYIRPDKHFGAVHEQLQLINSYALTHNMSIDDEFIDYISQNKRLEERLHVTQYFDRHEGTILLLSDVWVLTTNMEDLIQMFACLLRHKIVVHFIKQNVIISTQSDATLVLGLMDQLRQRLSEESKRSIGRPKGSTSSSKFDKYINEIVAHIKGGKSVSEMARILGVSRSSLKDYIESRELKQVAFGSLLPKASKDAEQHIRDTVSCPSSKKRG